ncbi:MAG: hypothetical protein JO032_13495 [Alphaproteobacteria bacterium]|nr:hypothetical protein [Alphaproteobacteria bacterium]MBV9553791.1 hypothetical protein [Alphaproteobacteria bacterium]
MQFWVLLGVLIAAELLVLMRIPPALISGEVPLNPLGWFGYGELMQERVARAAAPGAYWLIVGLLAAVAALIGGFIYIAAVRGLA